MEILRAGYYETYEQGFQPASIEAIVARAGVTKGAFFHYFPTKNDLGYAIADELLESMMLDRWIRPLAAYKNPIQGMIVRYRKNMEELSEERAGSRVSTQQSDPRDVSHRPCLQEETPTRA